MNNLHEHFVNGLKYINYAENQIVKALPDMIKAASDEELKSGLREHLAQTQKQIERLEKIGIILKENVNTNSNQIISSILAKGKEIIKDGRTYAVDAAIIAHAQIVEHYEIATYSTLTSWARVMEHEEEAELLEASLEEEKEASDKLAKLAEGGILQAGINTMALNT